MKHTCQSIGTNDDENQIPPNPRGRGDFQKKRYKREIIAILFGVFTLFLLSTLVFATYPGMITDPDLNNDGIVNILDASIVGICWGQVPDVYAPVQIQVGMVS